MATTQDTALFSTTDVTTPIINTKDVNNTDYITLHEADDVASNIQRNLTVNINQSYFTRYDNFGMAILISTTFFLLAWLIYIFYNFGTYGILTAYCKDPYYSCNENSSVIGYAECCHDTNTNKYCYIPHENNSCDTASDTISTFIIQLLLISLIIFQTYMLIQSSRKGIVVYHPWNIQSERMESTTSNGISEHIISLKRKFDAIQIDCRKYAYFEKETSQKTAVEFLYNSLIILAFLNLLQHSILILLNILTENDKLKIAGYTMLSTDLGNIIQTLYAKYCCCCNCYRGRCCWYDDCCCDPCCRVIGCRCLCDKHFPKHHRHYVYVIAQIVNLSNLLKLTAATSQITAVGYIDSTNEWHLWLICLNFLSGVIGIIRVLQVYWRYYYLLCFYWNRRAVNKYESHKIFELLRELLRGAYIFVINVDENVDEFIKVDENEPIANRVRVICDCFTFSMALNMICVCSGIVFTLWNWTEQLNQDFNVDERLQIPV